MSKLLTKLDIEEVSLVDEGANPDAHIAFFKSKKGIEMTIEELKKKLSEETAKVATLEIEKADLEILSKMSDHEKSYMDGLSDDDKKKFMGLDAEGRKKMMGDKYKKSLSPDDIKKMQDDVTKAETKVTELTETVNKRDEEIAKLKGDVETQELRAEVEKKYPNSKGTTDEKVEMLKSIRAIENEVVRKNLIDSMDQAERLATDFSKEKGKGSGDADVTDAGEKLQKMAKEIADKEGITEQQGFAKAIETKEGKELFVKSRSAEA